MLLSLKKHTYIVVEVNNEVTGHTPFLLIKIFLPLLIYQMDFLNIRNTVTFLWKETECCGLNANRQNGSLMNQAA